MIPGTKQNLFEKICKDPLNVSRQQVFYWAQLDTGGITFDDLRKLMLRIFDQNESSLVQASDASVGPIGWANRQSSAKRKRIFMNKINAGFRKDDHKIILAEGDSWFQFPFFIQDIVDYLLQKNDCAVYSMAYGGDWLTNIIYEGKYIEDISMLSPDVFLLSGGGNDLVGSNRIAYMVDRKPCPIVRYERESDIVTRNAHIDPNLLHPYDASKILRAQKFIQKEFYSFLWVVYIQFYLIFRNLRRPEKHQNMLILTQGYDYAIPYKGFRFDIRYPHQPIVNALTGTSKWLFSPLMIKGITNADDQIAILHALIFEFNLVFMDLVQQPEFPNVVHIDCRGVAQHHNDWFDELHLKSHVFSRIGKVMHDCIESYGRTPADPDKQADAVKKVVRVIDYS